MILSFQEKQDYYVLSEETRRIHVIDRQTGSFNRKQKFSNLKNRFFVYVHMKEKFVLVVLPNKIRRCKQVKRFVQIDADFI